MPSVSAFAFAAAVAAAAPAAPSPAPAPQGTAAEPPASATAPEMVRHVDEDDHVRVEELRVRGESRRIVVKPKMRGAKEYQIIPASGARDPSKGGSSAGERVWRVLSF
jgi:hypothetical protein